MYIPKEAEQIIEKLNNKGYEAYIVGGCVRDYLLGIEPKDYDITTSALPIEVKQIFAHTIDTGIEHGTVTVMLNHTGYEVTTYRIDGEYKDNRHPEEVIFTDKLSGDLARRDFTMNAIAYNHEQGFVDVFCGIEDIKNKLIRGVGVPSKRFQEDALRMLRALRFSAQLDFKIEQSTYDAICENAPLIANISHERVRDEFLKLLKSPHPEKIMLLSSTGLIDYTLPELKDILCDSLVLNLRSCPQDIVLRLAILYRGFEPKRVLAIFKNLRLDNNTISQVTTLIKYMDCDILPIAYAVRRLLSQIGTEAFKQLIALKRILYTDKDFTGIINLYDEIIDSNDCYSLAALAINGNDISGLGYTGKAIGEKLHYALDIVLKEPKNNTREYLLALLSDSSKL